MLKGNIKEERGPEELSCTIFNTVVMESVYNRVIFK